LRALDPADAAADLVGRNNAPGGSVFEIIQHARAVGSASWGDGCERKDAGCQGNGNSPCVVEGHGNSARGAEGADGPSQGNSARGAEGADGPSQGNSARVAEGAGGQPWAKHAVNPSMEA